MTTVSEVMTRGVRALGPRDTVVAAAQAMDELNVGAIPVCEGDTLLGMVTDRDIVVRAVAQDIDARAVTLAEVMSRPVRTVGEDEDVEEALATMSEHQIRRIPVADGQGRLVGMLSLGDIAAKDPDNDTGLAMSLADISSPAAPDR